MTWSFRGPIDGKGKGHFLRMRNVLLTAYQIIKLEKYKTTASPFHGIITKPDGFTPGRTI